MVKRVFIFDLDGVLIQSLGYQASMAATILYFIRRMELEEHLIPKDDIIALFESCQITSEWDMVPICLAAILDELQRINPTRPLPCRISELSNFRPVHVPSVIDYRNPILRLGPYIRPGKIPASTALKIFEDHQSSSTRASQISDNYLFPNIKANPIVRELLTATREVNISPTTRIFQHFTLGSEKFQQTYGLTPEITTPSLLGSCDKPLINNEARDRLFRLYQNGDLALAVYTMRPSLPPREISLNLQGYAPEAEIAQNLIEFSELPMIAYGRIIYLADKYGISPESYLKPCPVQALAAIFAAILNNEADALELSHKIFQDAVQNKPDGGIIGEIKRNTYQPLEINVFEDSLGGIEATRKAGEILLNLGVKTMIKPWGIAHHPDKISILKKAAVPVFSNVHEALDIAMN